MIQGIFIGFWAAVLLMLGRYGLVRWQEKRDYRFERRVKNLIHAHIAQTLRDRYDILHNKGNIARLTERVAKLEKGAEGAEGGRVS